MKLPHHIKNTKDFVQVQGIQLKPKECIASYDVSALFQSVSTDTAITNIRRTLELDQELHLRTTHTSRADHQPTGILFEDHLFPISTQVL